MIEQTCAEIANRSWDRGYVVDTFAGIAICCILWLIFNLPELISRRNKLVREIARLTKYNKGIVTVYDLVAAAEISPEKAGKFLLELARKLDVEPEVEETTGTRFYRFIDGDRISQIEAGR